MTETESKVEQLTEPESEYNKQEFIEELDIINNEMKKIEEKALKIKLSTSLMSLEMSTKIETIDSVKALHSLLHKASQIQIKSQNEGKTDEKTEDKTELQTNSQQSDVIVIEDQNESQVWTHVKHIE